MSDKKRYPTLCSWCQHCITGEDKGRRLPLIDPPSGYSTYCLKEHFDNDGKDNYIEKTECAYFELGDDVTFSDINWWPIAWAASEIDRLETKKIIMEMFKDKSQ